MGKIAYWQLKRKLEKKSFSFWHTTGEKLALRLFHRAAKEVPAYKDFLHKNNVVVKSIKTIDNFKNLPLINKENYLSQYSLNDLCWNGEIKKGGIISQSSGTTGRPYYWPRFVCNDQDTAFLHELIFKELYNSDKKATLFIVCFHLGAHVAGIITSNAIKDLIDDGMPGSLVTTGLNKKDIFNAVKDLSPYFDQTILIGYPPFLKDIIIEGEDLGINWADKKIKFLFSAESFPEEWRERLFQKIGVPNTEQGGYNIYGSADLGLMGHETPFSIRLRKHLVRGGMDRKKLGIEGTHVPGFYQCHPWQKYFEVVDQELVCTSDPGIPLIRYNTKDVGLIFDPKILLEATECKRQVGDWSLPMLLVFGRSNYNATVYGVNIYPEQIREILNKQELIGMFAGRFFLKTVFVEMNQILEIHVEVLKNKDMECQVKLEGLNELFAQFLQSINAEYKKLCEAVGKSAHPVIKLYSFGSEDFLGLKSKHKYICNNK